MSSAKELRKVLARLTAETSAAGQARELKALKHWLLMYGSETEDNVRAVRSLVLVPSRDGGDWKQPGCRGAGVSLSELAWALEDMPLPAKLRRRFPTLDQEKWEDSLRLVVLLLSALTTTKKKPRKTRRPPSKARGFR